MDMYSELSKMFTAAPNGDILVRVCISTLAVIYGESPTAVEGALRLTSPQAARYIGFDDDFIYTIPVSVCCMIYGAHGTDVTAEGLLKGKPVVPHWEPYHRSETIALKKPEKAEIRPLTKE